MTRLLTTMCELCGAGLVAYGAARVSLAAACIVGGAYLVTIAVRNG